LSLSLLATSIILLMEASPVHAQATRTWLSGVGDDANPCSRTAPCKTFAGAVSKTAAGGEINCTDPGGFGAVTITKSITIDCGGTVGSILAAGTNGVNINAANIVVVLRNLSIQGASTGLIGINAINMLALHLDNVMVMNFNGGSALGSQVRSQRGEHRLSQREQQLFLEQRKRSRHGRKYPDTAFGRW